MKLLTYTSNPFGVNTYICYDPVTLECAIIDPGMALPEEREGLKELLEKYGLKPVHLINTHLHLDHVFGNEFVRKEYGLKLKANERDAFLGETLGQQKRMFGMYDNGATEQIEEYLSDGDEIRIGEGSLKVLEVPGHSPGGIALYSKEDGFVITGDSLFQGSIGRTDLPGGDMDTLINALNKKLMTLPDDTKVYPGHGNPTTIGFERRNNPFL